MNCTQQTNNLIFNKMENFNNYISIIELIAMKQYYYKNNNSNIDFYAHVQRRLKHFTELELFTFMMSEIYIYNNNTNN